MLYLCIYEVLKKWCVLLLVFNGCLCLFRIIKGCGFLVNWSILFESFIICEGKVGLLLVGKVVYFNVLLLW